MKSKYYKHPTYGHVYGQVLKTPEGRLCWAALVTPKDPPPPQEGQQPGAPRYEITILLSKAESSTQAFLAIVKTMTSEMLELFNAGRKAKMALGDDLILDGDTCDLERYPFYAGNYVLAARNASIPVIVGADKTDANPNDFVGGCIVKAIVTPLITAHGVSYKLNVAQLIKDDGVRFGGGNAKATFMSMLDDDTESAPVTEEAIEAAATEIREAREIVETPVATAAAPKRGKAATLDIL